MALYFVRHGETDWNREKRFQSTTDVPLNDVGLAQAKCAGEDLLRRGVHIDELRCSPLQRAAVTARIIAEALGAHPITDPRLTEMSFGEWEGQLETELAEKYGGDFDTWRQSHYTSRPPGGEALIDVAERLHSALADLRPVAIGGNAMVVAHQAIMMAMKAALTGDYSVEAAQSYKQNNDEIDVWDLESLKRIDFFKIEYGS
jgi:broad specificity phosphatase PhoE